MQHAYLDGHEKMHLSNVASRAECAKACLMENSFACRSADYDESLRTCRLSKEDRRTQPQSFKIVPGSSREYIENQCAAPGEYLFCPFCPDLSCVEIRKCILRLLFDQEVVRHYT